MAYGLEVYGLNGELVVRYTDKLTRFIDYFVVGMNSSGSKSYPELVGQELLASNTVTGSGVGPHNVIVSGYTVSWNRGNTPTQYDVGATGITIVAVG
jgi:hypothetical protein